MTIYNNIIYGEVDPVKIFQAEQTAVEAIKARIEFWDVHNTKDLRHG